MHALALTSTPSDRAIIDRATLERFAAERIAAERARVGDAAAPRTERIEILAPSREHARAAARRHHETESRTGAAGSWSDDARGARRASATSTRFVAQVVAQQQPGNAAHVENWRGARAAYAGAGAPGGGRGAALSILI